MGEEAGKIAMSLGQRFRSWAQPIYFLGQNTITLVGAVITTSTALTTIAFWFYDIFLPGPPHPYIGVLIFLILPGIFVMGLLLIPIGECGLAGDGLLRRQHCGKQHGGCGKDDGGRGSHTEAPQV